jgi:uncharacterized protein (DUF342 family)
MNQVVKIRVSQDGMEAFMLINLPAKDSPKPTIADLETALETENIKIGIDREALEKILSLKPGKELCIARGIRPKKSTPSYIKVKKRLYESRPPIEVHGQIDFRMVSPFIMVKKGEPLAKRIEASEGEKGYTVTNEIISPEKKDIEQLVAGENTVEKEGVIYAVKSGRFEIDNKIFSINDVLDIPGDVDYSTGHISFPGDVIIHGQIKDGFRVAAGGSIHCKETLDASEVFSKKDLIIEGGIIGRNKGLIRVQGKIETKFIEHCHVESLGGISVKSSIIGSEISTLGELVLLKNGRLVGGTVYAEEGIISHSVGSSSNGNIQIFLGISFVEARHLQSQQKLLNDISQKKDQVKTLANEKKREELLVRVDETISRLQNSIAEQIVKQYTHFGAQLKVEGDILPGAVITICDRTLTVTEKISKTIVFYDEEKQRVSFKPLTK